MTEEPHTLDLALAQELELAEREDDKDEENDRKECEVF